MSFRAAMHPNLARMPQSVAKSKPWCILSRPEEGEAMVDGGERREEREGRVILTGFYRARGISGKHHRTPPIRDGRI